jgi:hypothetical protein
MNGRWLSGTSILAVAASAAGVALGGCGGASTANSVVDPVAQAAQVSELAPGFRASIIEEATAPGSSEPVTVSGTGVFDQRGHRGSMTMHIAAEGHSTTAQTQLFGPRHLHASAVLLIGHARQAVDEDRSHWR